MMTRKASEIRTGDQLIEGGAGGMLWRVDHVVCKGRLVTVTLNPVEADMLICRPAPDQVKTFHATSRVHVA
jgi:hypothetical protein